MVIHLTQVLGLGRNIFFYNIIFKSLFFQELDVCKAKVKDLEFTCPVQLEVTSAGDITAFVVYFDINFRLSNIVSILFCSRSLIDEGYDLNFILLLDSP